MAVDFIHDTNLHKASEENGHGILSVAKNKGGLGPLHRSLSVTGHFKLVVTVFQLIVSVASHCSLWCFGLWPGSY